MVLLKSNNHENTYQQQFIHGSKPIKSYALCNNIYSRFFFVVRNFTGKVDQPQSSVPGQCLQDTSTFAFIQPSNRLETVLERSRILLNEIVV